MNDKLKIIIGGFVFLWLTTNLLNTSGEKTVYFLHKTDPDLVSRYGWPDLATSGPITYKYSDGKIISKSSDGFVVNEYGSPDCKIFDIDNWQCTYSSPTGTYSHGFESGEYFSYNSKYPNGDPLAHHQESRLRFSVVACQWQYTGRDVIQGLIGCPVAFLFPSLM